MTSSPRRRKAPAAPDFRALFESAPGLYLVLDPALTIVAVSEAYLRATMTERAAILGRGIFDVFPDNPETVEATGVTNLRGSLGRVLSERRPDAMAVQKYDIRRPESAGGGFEERFWSPVNSPVLGADGEVRYIIHRVEDVTEFLRLRQQDADRHRASVDLQQASQAMEVEIFRRAQEIQEANRQLRDLQATLESRVAERTAALAGANDQLQQTVEALQATEEELLSTVEDLKETEESLRGALDQLKALVEASPQAIVAVDIAGRVQSWHGGAERMFGWSAEEVLGRPLPNVPLELLLEHDELRERVLQHGRVHDHQTVRRRKDGSSISVSLSCAPLHDAAGAITGVVGVYSDITARQRAEEEGRARQSAEAANRAKSQFLANMSHELRTPLNAIIGFSELLEDLTSGPLSDRQRRYVGNILSSGRHLLELVNDILDLAKIEAGRLSLDATCFEPVTAIREVRRIVEPLAVAKQLTLEVETAESLPFVTADRAKLKQILYNLLSNAIKFTPEGGRIWVRVGMRPGTDPGLTGGEWLQITVQDTGIGIRPEDHARVFLEFEQLDTTYGRQQTGTGLGLALTRRLVELHAGRIALQSAEGEGATFTVTLPRTPPNLRVDQTPEGLDLNGDRDADRPLVLVVEDDPVAAELLSHYLTSHGYAVARAGTAAAALEAAQNLRPVAITLDILLPDQDGLEVLAQLRTLAATRGIPVVVVSITDDRELGFSLGASEWLVKPVNRERFLHAVTRAIPVIGAGSGRTVLVIDDHRETVDLLADTLEHRGLRVLRAYGGPEGVRLAMERLPDAVVLDLIMPGLSGFEVARRLQEQEATRHIPVLIFTFKELSARERESLQGRVESIISKSDTGNLLNAIERLPARVSSPNVTTNGEPQA